MKKNISNDLVVERFKGGIKLMPPNKKSLAFNLQTLGHLLNFPISFYLLDAEGNTRKINEEGALVCGYDSVNQSIGKSILSVGEKQSAQLLIDNCKQVLDLNSSKIFEENHLRKDGNQHQFLSIKCPWYNQDNSIIGVCGFSIALGKHALAESLSSISQLGLLNAAPASNQQVYNIKPSVIAQLTKRELECLHYTIRGLTAKRIAQTLNISFRTVEEYLTNIRFKVGANSKTHLLEMVLEH